MNHCVPDFEFDDDYSIPVSSSRPKKSVVAEDDAMELLWKNGQVVMQSQNQRSIRKSQPSKFDQSASLPHHQQQQDHNLFMHEDEMASWLHFDSDFCPDLLYNNNSNNNEINNLAPCVTSTAATTCTTTGTHPAPTESRPQQLNTRTAGSTSRPPIPLPPRGPETFDHFSRNAPATGVSGKSNPSSVMMTVVHSSDTPAVASESNALEAKRSPEGASGVNNRCGIMSGTGSAGTSYRGSGCPRAARDSVTCELTTPSSPGSEATSADIPAQKPPDEDRKRKGRKNDGEGHQDVDAKNETGGSTSTKRSRAAEVHNLSERRRRDRINEKMRALQELIPRCNKSDKASMLDEAAEYLKSLQLQVQMLSSMGCGMVPMMFPGFQQYMRNMGMGMDMGINRPMMAFPNVLAGSAMPTPAAAAHLGPRFPIPALYMPTGPAPDPSRVQAANQPDPMLNSFGMQNPNQPRAANFVDPHHQYLPLHQMQSPLQQNQSMFQPNTSQPCTTRGAQNPKNRPLC